MKLLRKEDQVVVALGDQPLPQVTQRMDILKKRFGDRFSNTVNFVISALHLGIRRDFNQFSGPRAMVPYRAGEWYFHGGASLQEAVVPVIAVRMQETEGKFVPQAKITLNYKRGATKITTRLPVIEISVSGADLLSLSTTFEILIKAHDKQGNVVGEIKLGGMHDREIRIDNGWIIKIGRGLDFYQKPVTWFSIGANDLNLRPCLETKVAIFPEKTEVR